MNANQAKIKALGLCSGGLDSILSALVLQKQGIHVEWICFETPFFSSDKAKKASHATGIPLTVRNITETYLQMLRNPNCGYGKNMNPCMDCHALMFKLAGEVMAERNAHFLFSGEVLGQRPMSQTRNSLKYVEKHSGMKGYILRPLSALKLEETEPEKNGWVDRQQLLDISGRGRKQQIRLANKFGITEYPAPAGGCLLTDNGYCRRLKDLLDHKENVSVNELMLLSFGRHFRTVTGVKIIVGRTKQDNDNIYKYRDPELDTVMTVSDYPSPFVLISGQANFGELYLAAAICAGYTKLPERLSIEVTATNKKGAEILRVLPVKPSEVKHLLV
ncbi:MAG: tRNA 4-thiouridine(8) synthase ThiI [Desulfobacterales bacterium]